MADVDRLLTVACRMRPAAGGRHLDGNPSNNHVSNLAWGTGKQNWRDRKRHGRVNAAKSPETRKKMSEAAIRHWRKQRGES